jgi:branched-subunit amino acid aminotransferase/4-amino-4-deoxychorismate lyase
VLCFSSSLLGLIRRYFQCYKSEEGDLMLFRPKKNFDRFKRSAGRLGLPVRTDHLC